MNLSTEFLQNMIHKLSDALFVLDPDGTILFINDAFVQMFGYTARELLHMNTFQLVDTGQLDVHILAQVLKQKAPVTARQRYIQKNGRETPYMLVTQTPVFDAYGEVKYSVGTIRDMERLERIYRSSSPAGTRSFSSKEAKLSPSFVFASQAMERLIAAVTSVANSDAAILILGESGSGKEVLADYIHQASGRGEKPLVAINCAALPENLLEAELFGYEKGAFTGAMTQGKLGLIELAAGGTLFLDEINSMPLSLQGKLLRVLETKQVRRIGGVKSIAVDFRLLSAANTDLRMLIEKQLFRMDLYYRISVLPFDIPPLRSRREDIRPLCDHFLRYYEKKYGRKKSFSPLVYQKLESYHWPGNVRELKNLIERIVLVTDVSVTEVSDIQTNLLEHTAAFGSQFASLEQRPSEEPQGLTQPQYCPLHSLKENLDKYEQWMIRNAMEQHGSLAKAAAALGSSKSALGRKVQNYQSKDRP